MSPQLKLVVLIALVGGALASACGGGAPSTTTTPTSTQNAGAAQSSSSSAASTTGPSTTTTTANTTTTAAATTSATATGPSRRVRHRTQHAHPSGQHSGASPPATSSTTSSTTTALVPPASVPDRAQKVALCHQTIASVAETMLTPAETKALDNLCDIAASGNNARVRAAERKICLTVVRDSGLPAAAAAAEEQSCNQATLSLGG